MEDEETYKTIATESEGLFTDKGSRFIAYLTSINKEEEANTFFDKIKKKHPKARHHCFAWRLVSEQDLFRVNDAGEPGGTAGMPIFRSFCSYDIFNVMCVVVRYFGGTLLGTSGLIRAYKQATIEAIENNSIITKENTQPYFIVFNYDKMDMVMKNIKQKQVSFEMQKADMQCVVRVLLSHRKREEMESLFALHDDIQINKNGECSG